MYELPVILLAFSVFQLLILVIGYFLFKKDTPSEVDMLLLTFFKDGGVEKFATEQSATVVAEQTKANNLNQERLLVEKCAFYTDKLKKGKELTNEEDKEFEYFTFLIKYKNIH